MLYLTIKAIHIVAVISWIGSLGLITLITSNVRMDEKQIRIATRLTETSIGITWLAGITLVILGGWYGATWWQLKVVVVIVISAIHTIVHRRWKASVADGAQTHSFVPLLLFFLTVLVVFLVVFKQPA